MIRISLSRTHKITAAIILMVVAVSLFVIPKVSDVFRVDAGCSCCEPRADGGASGNCDFCSPDGWECKGDNGCDGGSNSNCRNCGGWRGNACGGGGGGPPPPPPCTISAPGPATLGVPAHLAINLEQPLVFTWGNSTGWGEGCPNANQYILYMKEKQGINCNAGTWVVYAQGWIATATVSSLKWGTTYCWLVQKHNRGSAANSAIREFTTAYTPVISNVRVNNAIKCGGALVSGRAAGSDVNNPIELSMDVSSEYNDFSNNITRGIVAVRVGVVPDSVQAAPTVAYSVIEPLMRTRLGFGVAPVTPSGALYTTINSASAPYWSTAFVGSGDLTNAAATASVLSLNNATRVEVLNNKTAHVTWMLRFEDTFPTAADGIYVQAIGLTPGNNTVSQGAVGTGATTRLIYTRAMSWRTDLKAPTADVTQPTALNTKTFTMKWSASDTDSGIRTVRSYCYADSNPPTLIDQTVGQAIDLPETELTSSDPANCLVTPSNLGDHTYTISSIAYTSDLHFKLYAQDGACNESEPFTKLDSPAAWIVTSHGSVSADGGYTNLNIRNVATLAGIVPNLGQDSYLSTYLALGGTGFMVNQFQSKNNFYVTNYDDKATLPPEISGASKWFDYLYQLAAFRQKIDTVNTSSMGGNISAALGATPGGSAYRYYTGNLTINSGTVCDLNAAIFVAGDLTVQPDLTKSTPYVGCVFVVKGDIAIATGTTKTSASVGPTQPSSYDRVEGAFVTDGTFLTVSDQQANLASSWSVGTPGGTARADASAVVYGTRMYIYGGYTGSNSNVLNYYDVSNNTWGTLAANPGGPRREHSSVVYNGKMYVFGGLVSAATKLLFSYDFATNTWATLTTAAAVAARYEHVAVVHNGKMYAWGGRDSGGVKTSMEIYDFATGVWTKGASSAVNTGSYMAISTVYNNKMYVFGGAGLNNRLMIYDIASNTWSFGASNSATRSNMNGIIYNNKWYIWAGYLGATLTDRMDVYDFGSDTWSFGVPGGTIRRAFTTATLNGKMYNWGGVNAAGGYINSVSIYDFGTPLAGDALYIHGTVYAGDLDLSRDLGLAQNTLQPAEVFDYDPAYARIFRSLFGIRTFSLRGK